MVGKVIKNVPRSIQTKTVESATIALFIFLSFPLFAFGAEGFAEQYHSYQSATEKGKNAFDRKDYPAAAAEYSRVIALSPFESEIYFRRGVALFKSGREIRKRNLQLDNKRPGYGNLRDSGSVEKRRINSFI